ncbi:hypothetical protein BKA70DRAFT_1444951 [Coprinopsis sp. MPI-PUGE-AT-0042]|nr:hypothetical protein BKA70DRAFT_1444951 [Coprinopsis sp. MPI-PUGE-AT-0042]
MVALGSIFARVNSRAATLHSKRSLCLKGLAAVTSIFLPPLSPCITILKDSAWILEVARPTRNYIPIFEAGLLQALVSAFPSCDRKGEEERSLGQHILSLLAAIACYPRNLKVLCSEVSKIEPLLKTLGLNAGLNPRIAVLKHFGGLLSMIPSNYLDILTSDNNCSYVSSPYDSRPAVKACSGCYFVTYCTVQCQREDWLRRHRFECAELGQPTQGHHNALRISLAAKAFHFKLATDLINQPGLQDSCKSERLWVYPKQRATDILIMDNMTYPSFPTKDVIFMELG